MTRTIHLAIFSNGPRPAHYSLFIPTGTTKPKGKIIHVTGNIALGFHHQFKRNYDFADEERRYILLPLAEVDEWYIRDSPVESPPTEDATARDRLESEALPVRPPGPNARPFDPLAPNCQDWMVEYVQRLVEQGCVDGSALSIVQNAPRIL